MTNPIKAMEGEVNTNSTDINPVEIPAGLEQIPSTRKIEQEPDTKTSTEFEAEGATDNTVVKENYAEIMRETVPDKGGLPQDISNPWVSSIIEKVGDIKNISTGYGSKNSPFSV